MLYISRHIGIKAYGVVDTDDGVEETVELLGLNRIVDHVGLDIRGIRSDLLRGNCLSVDDIDVYQADIYRSPVQLKAQMVCRTEVKIWRNMVTSVVWDSGRITSPVSIRLSDFGRECADCILWGNAPSSRHKVTLVIDNFIKLSPHTFYPQNRNQKLTVDDFGIKFDLRECTSGIAARLVYDAVVMNASDYISACDSIIDSDKRKDAMLRGWGMMRF